MKKYLVFGLLVLGGIVYYTGAYTIFIRTDVQDSAPTASSPEEKTETIASGNFVEVDIIHKGSGAAKLIQVGNVTTLRFENFNVVNGPDLYVYLSKSESPTGDIASLGDYLDLGPLKGTSGNQNYAVRDDASGYKTAVVWCKRYGVLFTYAPMK